MQFTEFKTAVQRQFNEMKELNVFRVSLDKDKLWKIYLSSFPEGTNPIYKERTELDDSIEVLNNQKYKLLLEKDALEELHYQSL